MADRNMRGCISNPALQEALVPDYPIGGKRILISDNYYQTLGRDNVDVITDGIAHLTEDGIVTEAGRSYRAEVVILATGFESTSFLVPMVIEGRRGRSLNREWADGVRAYLGIAVSGFPNFFMMYGPNTNLGHNSIIFMIECQTRYIVECIQRLIAEDLKYLDLRPEVMEAYNRRLQEELERTVWAATGKSWYKTADGKITNNWSGSTIRYWWRTRKANFGLYHQEAGAHAQAGAPAKAVAPSGPGQSAEASAA